MRWINETEADIRNLIQQDFGPQIGPLTSVGILDWMHYRTRLIPRRRRTVMVSKEVAAQLTNHPAIAQVKAELERGGDVAPWLSDRVRSRKDNPFADLMFNDWQISHFHLGSHFVAPDKVARTDHRLFALIKADRAVFLDVKGHGRETYTAQEVLRVLLRTSPEDLPEWKGAIPQRGGPGWSDAELLELRQAGISYSIQIDGRLFSPPGLGQSTSRHATRILVRHLNPLNRTIRNVMLNGLNCPLPPLPAPIIAPLPPRLGVRLRDDGCLVLREKTRAFDVIEMLPFE
jgi:hypothetical protein